MPTFLYIYEQHKFHAQLSLALKDVITSGPEAGFDTLCYVRPLVHLAGPVLRICNSRIGEAQWLSGRELDSRGRVHGFELYQRHCVVSLSKTH